MQNLFDKVQMGDKVIGKTTKQEYTVCGIDHITEEWQDAIWITNPRGKPVSYTRSQFNYHFKPCKKIPT